MASSSNCRSVAFGHFSSIVLHGDAPRLQTNVTLASL